MQWRLQGDWRKTALACRLCTEALTGAQLFQQRACAFISVKVRVASPQALLSCICMRGATCTVPYLCLCQVFKAQKCGSPPAVQDARMRSLPNMPPAAFNPGSKSASKSCLPGKSSQAQARRVVPSVVAAVQAGALQRRLCWPLCCKAGCCHLGALAGPSAACPAELCAATCDVLEGLAMHSAARSMHIAGKAQGPCIAVWQQQVPLISCSHSGSSCLPCSL